MINPDSAKLLAGIGDGLLALASKPKDFEKNLGELRKVVDEVDIKLADIAAREAQARKTQQDAKRLFSDAERVAADAKRTSDEIERLRAAAQRDYDEQSANNAALTEQLQQREQNVVQRERGVAAREDALAASQKKLEEAKAKLALV